MLWQFSHTNVYECKDEERAREGRMDKEDRVARAQGRGARAQGRGAKGGVLAWPRGVKGKTGCATWGTRKRGAVSVQMERKRDAWRR